MIHNSCLERWRSQNVFAHTGRKKYESSVVHTGSATEAKYQHTLHQTTSCSKHGHAGFTKNFLILAFISVSLNGVFAAEINSSKPQGTLSKHVVEVNGDSSETNSGIHTSESVLTKPTTSSVNQRKTQEEEKASCVDNPDYTSPLGLGCANHKGVNCAGFRAVGFSDDDIYSLINNCPQSCDVKCGTWTLSPSFSTSENPSIFPSNSPSDSPSVPSSASPSFNPSNSHSNGPSVSPSVSPSSTPSVTPSANPSSVHDRCENNSEYISPQGLRCGVYVGWDCESYSIIGFTEVQIYELISNCPRSCNIPCGTYTTIPTTTTQSKSVAPSVEQSAEPSNHPNTSSSATTNNEISENMTHMEEIISSTSTKVIIIMVIPVVGISLMFAYKRKQKMSLIENAIIEEDA